MRPRSLLLLALPFAGGCLDSLGIGSSCAAEMQGVRLAEGGGPSSSQRADLGGGNFRELWIYERISTQYIFYWGPSYESCQVEGPKRFSVAPVE